MEGSLNSGSEEEKRKSIFGCIVVLSDFTQDTCLKELSGFEDSRIRLLEPKAEPVEGQIVHFQDCSTRKEGTVLLQKLQQLRPTCFELQSSPAVKETKQVLKERLINMRPLWEQYIEMPKCSRCHTTRSRVERETTWWNGERFIR